MSKDHNPKGEYAVFEHADGRIEDGLTRESSHKVLGMLSVDAKMIRAKFDEYLRGVFDLKLEDCGAHDAIASQIERRIEVAAKSACAKLETNAAAIAAEMLRKRIERIIGDMEITVTVVCTQEGCGNG